MPGNDFAVEIIDHLQVNISVMYEKLCKCNPVLSLTTGTVSVAADGKSIVIR